MPRPAKNRQIVAAPAQTISSFTRVSKSHAFLQGKALKPIAGNLVDTPSRKRKASTVEEQEDSHVRLGRRTVSFPPSSDDDDAPSKRTCRRKEPQICAPATATPTSAVTKGKRTAKATPSRTSTAHKPSASTIIAHSKHQCRTIQTKIDVYHKKAVGKPKAGDDGNALPPHLDDLVRLHKAFLKTVMIRFAHNGSNAPLDISVLVPDMSRAWGKRKVTMEDIRRCVALQSSAKQEVPSPFIVTDYGRGKVCVELGAGYNAAGVNEKQLCTQLLENLQLLCAERAESEMTDVDDISLASLSLGDLPQAAITDMKPGRETHPQLTKGQQALSDLKTRMFSKQQEKDTRQAAAATNPTRNADGSKMSLLDRLRMKETAKADGPSAPSGPELQRRGALNRVASVAATISMLSLASPVSLPRQAFALPALLERLKDSLRMPISKEEGTACVRLIAGEVAPEWLRMVTIGGSENVVVQRNGQPVDRVIQERVQKLLA